MYESIAELSKVLIISGVFIWFCINLFRNIDKVLDIIDERTKLKNFELYSNIDLELVEKSVDAYFHITELEYIKYHFTAKNQTYITSSQQTDMIREVTKQIVINIPESYIFYIKLLRNISTDDDLIKYIHERVSILSITDVSEYNKEIE